MIPAMIPENKGAPDANAIPRHKGSATKKTTNPDGRSDFTCLKYVCMVCMVYFDLCNMNKANVKYWAQ